MSERAKTIANECIGWFSSKLTRAEAELEITKIIERELIAISDRHTSADDPRHEVAMLKEQRAHLDQAIWKLQRERDEALDEAKEARNAIAVFEKASDLAQQLVGIANKLTDQRDRRIAELEAAAKMVNSSLRFNLDNKRGMVGAWFKSDVDYSELRRLLDVALSPAPAQPAPIKGIEFCKHEIIAARCAWCAAPPSPAALTVTGMTCGCGRGMVFDDPDLWSCPCGVRVRTTTPEAVISSTRNAVEKATKYVEAKARAVNGIAPDATKAHPDIDDLSRFYCALADLNEALRDLDAAREIK